MCAAPAELLKRLLGWGGEGEEEGAEEDAPPKLVWISDAEANI